MREKSPSLVKMSPLFQFYIFTKCSSHVKMAIHPKKVYEHVDFTCEGPIFT